LLATKGLLVVLPGLAGVLVILLRLLTVILVKHLCTHLSLAYGRSIARKSSRASDARPATITVILIIPIVATVASITDSASTAETAINARLRQTGGIRLELGKLHR
jgi:predicted permease